VCLCVRSEPVNQTVAALNVYSFKTVKSTDFKFDTRVFRDSPDMIFKIYGKWAWPGSRDPQFLGIKMFIATKRLKLPSSNFTCMFQ